MSRAKKAAVGIIAATVTIGILVGIYFAICAAKEKSVKTLDLISAFI